MVSILMILVIVAVSKFPTQTDFPPIPSGLASSVSSGEVEAQQHGPAQQWSKLHNAAAMDRSGGEV
jgi:hypothetical protein